MPRLATKAANNKYYQARIAAATYNDRLFSREGASELNGIEQRRLANIELDLRTPYPEEVVLMADTYNAPELLNWHCTKDCPIGRRTMSKITVSDEKEAVLNLLGAFLEVEENKGVINDLVKRVSGEGELDESVLPLIEQVKRLADDFYVRAQELALCAEKSLKNGKGG